VKRNILNLIKEEYIVLDGGMGTLLQEEGLCPDEVPEEWNITHPRVIEGIHYQYLEAGAQIIETNTFGGSRLKLRTKDKENLVEEVNRDGAMAARRAVERWTNERGEEEVYIACSIGPTGKILKFEISVDEAEEAFTEQGNILAKNGVDLFMVETMMDVTEACTAVKALKKSTDLPVFASLVFNRTGKGEFKTLFGNGIKDSVMHLMEAGADALGANCGLIEDYIEVIKIMRQHTRLPLILYPNAGVPRLKEGRTYFEQKPEHMISYLNASIEAGATIIGGCCGTTPNYISLLAEKIKGKKLF